MNSGNGGIKAKVCLLGERGVGKSALVQKYVLDQFSDEYFATMGMKVYKKTVYVVSLKSDEAVPVTMILWDLMGGDKHSAPNMDICLYGASGVMAVADVNEPYTVTPLEQWVFPALESLGDIPVQIIMNKWDAGEDQQAREFGRDIGRKHLAPCYLTSASKGDNVERAFNDLAQRIYTQKALSTPMPEEKTLEIVVGSKGETMSLEDLSADLGMTPTQAEPCVRSLVRSGHLILQDVDMASDGSPVMKYAATGKLLQITA